MKRLLFRSLVFIMCLLHCITNSAQTVVYTEGFESGSFMTDWTQSTVPAGSSQWSVGGAGLTGVTSAYQGATYAWLSGQLGQESVMLSSQLIDVSALNDKVCSFALVQPSYSGGISDMLKVYARSSITESWFLVSIFNGPLDQWQLQEVVIPQEITDWLQLGFEFNYVGGRGIGIDQVQVANAANCTEVTGLSVARTTESSVSLRWTSMTTADSYQVKVSTVEMNDMSQTANVRDTVVYFSPMNLTGLQPNTTYYFYVRANCGPGGIGAWSEVGTFKTTCVVASLPLEENFDAYTSLTNPFPPCWTKLTTRTGDWSGFLGGNPSRFEAQCVAGGYNGSTGALKMQSYFETSDQIFNPMVMNNYVSTQAIGVSDLATCQLSFYMQSIDLRYQMQVGVMTDPTDETTFEPIANVHTSTIGVWEQIIIPLSGYEGSGKFVTFKMEGGNGINLTQSILIDDVKVNVIDVCAKPTLLYANQLTPSSALLSWTGANNSYRLVVSETQIDPTSQQGNIYDGNVTATNYALTGLQQDTKYYFYVLNNCTPNASWSNEASFRTSCGAITSFPYRENFENYGTRSDGWDNAFPTCWSRMQSISQIYNYPYITSMSLVNGSGLYFYSSPNNFSMAILPEMGVEVNTLTMRFKGVITNPESWIAVGVMTDPNDTSTFVEVTRIIPDQTIVLNDYTVYFDQYSGNGKYIAFKSQRNQDNYFYMDDVVVEEVDACIPTHTLNFSQITINSALALWNSVNGATSYRVKMSLSPLSNPSSNYGVLKDTVVTTTSCLLSDLSASTTYYLYVQNQCGADNAKWVEKSFKTSCGIIAAVPYYENFNLINLGTMPSCWQVVRSGNTYPSVENSSTDYGYNNTASLRMRGSNVLLAMPAIDGSLTNLQLSCYVAFDNSESGDLTIGFMTDTTNANTFVALDTIVLNSYRTPTLVEVPLNHSALVGNSYHIAFKQTSYSDYNSIWIDEIVIEPVPSCSRVVSASVVSLTEQSAIVTWSPVQGEQSWRVAVGAAPYMPGDAHGTIYTVQTPRVEMIDLDVATNYDYYVQAVCGSGDSSQWSASAFNFTTTTLAATIPYLCSFETDEDNENWFLSNGSVVNQWNFGQAVSASGNKSLYISNDNGVSHQYSYTQYAHRGHVYAYRALYFEAGQYNIAFDWRANGYQGLDFLAAFLVPATAQQLVGGFADLPNNKPYTGYNFSVHDLIDGWHLLGGSILQLSNNWQNFSQTATITESGNYYLVYYWKNDYQSWVQNSLNAPAAIDNVSITAISCGSPVNIEVEMTDTNAYFTWTSFNEANLWDVKVSSYSLGNSMLETATGNIYNGSVSQEALTVNGLNGNTTYYFYVRSHCTQTDMSRWTTYEFKTPCSGIIDFPFVENFNNYGNSQSINCWTQVSGSVSSYIYNNYGGQTGASLYLVAPTNSTAIAALPRLDADSVKNTTVSFYAYYYNTGAEVELGVMTDLDDPNTFVSMHKHRITSSSTWEYVEVDMSSYQGDGQYIAFRVAPNDTYSYAYMFVDNVKVIKQNPCKKSRVFVADNLNPTSARLSWNNINSNALYTVKLDDNDFNPDLSTECSIYDEIQDNFLYLNSLTPGTVYYAYMRSECDDEMYSEWSDLLTFKVPCTAVDVPVVETFVNQTTNEELPCWLSLVHKEGSIGNSYTPLFPHVVRGTDDGTDGYAYRLYSPFSETSNSTETVYNHTRSVAILPLVTSDINSLQLSFNHFTDYYGSRLYIGIMDDPADFSTLEPYDSVQLGDWKESIITLSNYSGNGKYIAIYTDASKTRLSYSAYIDNVMIDSIRQCQAPTTPWTTGVTDSKATLHWGSVTGQDTLWHVQLLNLDLGMNVEALDTMNAFVLDTLVSQPWVTVSGLDPQTTYFYYVRSVCANGIYSDRYKKAMSFTTTCAPQQLPLFEGFDTEDAFNGCWTIALQNEISSKNPTWSLNTYTKFEGAGSAVMTVMRENYNSYLISPKVTIPAANQYRVRFMMYRNEMVRVDEGINVWVNTTPDTIGGTLLRSVDRSISQQPVVAVAGWYEYIDTIPYAGSYYIIFEGKNRSGSSIYLDNIAVESINNCERVSFITHESVKATEAKVLWENPTQLSVEYVVGVRGFDPNASQPVEIGIATSVNVDQLVPNTDYDVYVRTICGNSNNSLWVKTSFTTKQLPAQLPFVCDFENAAQNAEWSIVGNNASQFYIGSAVASQGNNALYISNENGNNNQYDPNSNAYAFAFRSLHFEGGVYNINFSWQAQGEYNADLGSVFLAPASAVILPNSNNGIYSTYSCPEGWQRIGQPLQSSSYWQTFNQSVSVPEPGDYLLVFYWTNNSNAIGLSPALAIDELTVAVETCHTPFNARARMIEGDNAIITAATDAQQMQVKVDTRNFALSNVGVEDAFIDTLVNGNSVHVTGLSSTTTYNIWIRTICNGDTTAWIQGNSFTTMCDVIEITPTLSYQEDFENYPISYNKLMPDCWAGSSYQPYYYPTIIYNSYAAFQGDKYFSMRVQNENSNSYAVLPEFSVAVQNLQLRFFGMNANSYGTKGVRVGVISDKEDLSTFEQVAQIPYTNTYTEFMVNFTDYTGNGKYIAIIADDATVGTYSEYRLDNVTVEFVALCQQPSMLTSSQITANSATIQFVVPESQSQWQIKLSTTLLDNPTNDVAYLDTLVNATQVTLTDLTPNTFYYYYVRSICSANDTSAWSSANYFMTECASFDGRMFEQFEGARFPSHCWERLTGNVNALQQGNRLVTTANGWSQNNSAILGSQHAAISMDRSFLNYWLVSPEIALADSAALTFDLAISSEKSIHQAPTVSSNDRFMVMISTDGGANWDEANATIWSNGANGDYAFRQLNNQGNTFEIDLLAYSNQNIRVAFYAESSDIHYSQFYDLHLDNVRVNTRQTFPVADTHCDGYNYNDYGFVIPMADLVVENSPYSFTRSAWANEGPDSIVKLELTINPTIHTPIAAAICDNETYNENGFQVSSAGVYRRNLNAANGCDSVITLTLTVNPTYEVDDELHIYESQLPYTYLGVVFDESTPIGASRHIIIGTTTEGCDSVVNLILQVDRGTEVADVWNRTCMIYPNPVKRNQAVVLEADFTEQECQEMMVEVYNSAGQRVLTIKPEQFPVQISGLEQSGVYMVRVIDPKGLLYHTKLIVQ